MRITFCCGLPSTTAAWWLTVLLAVADEPTRLPAEIGVVDAATERGIPLVELETVHGLRFVTDNAGRLAFFEPGLMGREIFFSVRSHGYEIEKDGFGFQGARITPRPGMRSMIKLTRRNVAERWCRLTGEGLYRDTVLLGHEAPQESNGKVAGQDSVQAAVHRGRVYWFWGDTQRLSYPLGLFRTAGATTPLFKHPFDLSAGIRYDYFVDKSGFVRAMMPLPERPNGVIWIAGVCVVPDKHGVPRLIAHYSRRKNLKEELEQGIAAFDDNKAAFEPVTPLPLNETWRRPSGHPVLFEERGKQWLLFGSPTPNVRVSARFEDVLDPDKYEAFTCATENAATTRLEPDLDASGKPRWRWQKKLPPVDSKTEQRWLKDGKIAAAHTRFLPASLDNPSQRIVLHSGTVRFNRHRSRWIMVAGQVGGTSSFLGEVWYAEADTPLGPFAQAVRVVTHDRQSFYNVCHHDFLDQEMGRIIHFEGTYTNDFSGNPLATPRYNYNQVLYRLDLESAPLRRLR